MDAGQWWTDGADRATESRTTLLHRTTLLGTGMHYCCGHAAQTYAARTRLSCLAVRPPAVNKRPTTDACGFTCKPVDATPLITSDWAPAPRRPEALIPTVLIGGIDLYSPRAWYQDRCSQLAQCAAVHSAATRHQLCKGSCYTCPCASGQCQPSGPRCVLVSCTTTACVHDLSLSAVPRGAQWTVCQLF